MTELQVSLQATEGAAPFIAQPGLHVPDATFPESVTGNLALPSAEVKAGH